MRRAVALLLTALAATPAAAADLGLAGTAPAATEAGIPACDDPAVLDAIVERQHWAEANTWQDGVRIEAISDVRQRYGTVTFTSAIRHRHCDAQVALTTTRSDRLLYVISADQGFASLSWGVEFCLTRHDAYRVYDGGCRVLR